MILWREAGLSEQSSVTQKRERKPMLDSDSSSIVSSNGNGGKFAHPPAWQQPPAHLCDMGGTTGQAPCRPPAPPLPASDQEGAPEDGPPKGPETTSTLDRLAQATGGTEKSWYRCVFPFGVISLVIGVAGTGVTFTFNNLPQTKVVSVVLLGVGLVLVLTAAVCWRVHKMKREKKKEGEFSSEQCPL